LLQKDKEEEEEVEGDKKWGQSSDEIAIVKNKL
jgi:hypothetical protein